MLMVPQAYARAKVTDYAVVGGGGAISARYGWRGRYGTPGVGMAGEVGLPFVVNGERTGAVEVTTYLPFLTTRTYDQLAPGPEGRIAEGFWVGIVMVAALSVRLEVNPVEFLDFLSGWAGLDLLKDDDWTRRLQAADKRKIEDEDDDEDEHEKR